MRLASWNVNGIRAVYGKGFLDWFAEEKADVVSLQEIKAQPEQLEKKHEALLHPLGYHSFWNPAERKGYSGTAFFLKKEPLNVIKGMGIKKFDVEGRVITAEFQDFYLVNAYFPNSQPDHARLAYKIEFCQEMIQFCNGLKKKGKNVVLCGDYNIAHQEIDLANPKTNKNTAGFLPEERKQMDEFLQAGYRDVFRERHSEGNQYTWWTYRFGARDRNIGWRIDYHCVNEEFSDRVLKVGHEPQVMGSDHCPVYLELKD